MRGTDANLAEFLTHWVDPVLALSSFERQRSNYLLEGPDGRTAVIGFAATDPADPTRFACRYGVVTPTLQAWREYCGVPQLSVLTPADAVLTADLPRSTRPEPGARRRGWDIREDGGGEALRTRLADVVVPEVESWFDPATLAQAVAAGRPGHSPALEPAAATAAIAWAEAGGPVGAAALRDSLAALPAGHPVREWVQHRALRRNGSGEGSGTGERESALLRRRRGCPT